MPDWHELDAAFDRALDLDGPARDDFLASLDDEIRSALEPLVRDALGDDAVLDQRRAVLGPLAALPDSVGLGERVGPYCIEALVGEGGMGRVYRARRADGAFDQTVAVKVVRQSLALAGSDVAARLRRERALLATLDHPGIARLLDGGETDDGVPYLVTEFVDGLPLTEYADSARLGVADRVRLIAEVARAVDHAHRRFVVHRDLKPSNVLVSERDGAARPVVLDFGIAKLMEAAEQDTGAFPLTQTGLRMLTPAYAAPELYEPTATVTTAADVYGLGALLYEILTGHRPHDDAPGRIGPATTEPTRPSKIVTGSAAPSTPYLARRARALRGDLDLICLRALHPDPSRRYASAADLAEDLARTLDGRPVEARPDSIAYVAGRFARRHRATVAAASLALVALVGGLAVTLTSLQSERAALAASEAATVRAEEAAGLLASVFAAADPEPVSGREVSAREALAASLDRLVAVDSDPLRAYLLHVVGRTYIQMGDPLGADSLLERSLAAYGEADASSQAGDARIGLASTRLALDDPGRALALGWRVHHDHQQSDPALALRGLRVVSAAHHALGRPDSSLAVAETIRRLTPDDAPPEEQIRSLVSLGMAYAGAGRSDRAVEVLRQAYALSLEDSGPESVRTTHTRQSLATVLTSTGAHREAEALLRISLAYQSRVFGPNTVAYVHASIAGTQSAAGDYRAAAASLDSAITMNLAWLPRDHPDTVMWRVKRAVALNHDEQYPAAEAVARQAVEGAEGDSDPDTLAAALAPLAVALDGRGQRREAREVRQRMRSLTQRTASSVAAR